MKDLLAEGRKIYETFKKKVNESITNATIGKNQKGKTAIFFPDKNTFVKELKKYLPKDTKISSSQKSFGGFGYGISIAFKFNGIDFSSIGGQPTVELLEGLLAFRKDLEAQFNITTGDNSYMIGFGDDSDYDVVLGMPDAGALERMITHWKSKSTQESYKSSKKRMNEANPSDYELEATKLRDNRWAVLPKGRSGTTGFYPEPWEVVYVNASSAAEAIKKVEASGGVFTKKRKVPDSGKRTVPFNTLKKGDVFYFPTNDKKQPCQVQNPKTGEYSVFGDLKSMRYQKTTPSIPVIPMTPEEQKAYFSKL